MRKQRLISCIVIPFITSVVSAEVNLYKADIVSPDTVDVALPEVEILSAQNVKAVTSSTPYQKIDAERIKIAGISDIADAMKRLPGVNLRDYGGAGGLKTISVRGLGSQHTAVVYDGVTLSDAQSGQIDLSRYSLDNVNAISLYSGDNDDIFMPAKAAASASSLYITSFSLPESGDTRLRLNARMKGGSYGYFNPFVRVSKGFGKRGFYSANIDYIHADNDYSFKLVNGQYVTKERRYNSQMDSWHGELNGNWEVAKGSRLNAKLYYYQNHRHLPGPVVYYVSGNDERLTDRNFFGQLQFKGRLNSKLSLLSTAKFNWATSRYKEFAGKYENGVRDDYYIQRETYATAALLFTPLNNFSFDYSADWSWNNLSSNVKNNIRPYRHTILQTIAAKYNVWRLTAMARLLYSLYINEAKDGNAGRDKSGLSPMLSLSMKPMEDYGFYVRGSYKNIFRMPTFNEAYYDNNSSANLEPEITDQFNLGVTYQTSSLPFISDFVLTCDGYINRVKNKIVAIPYNLFLWSMTNLGKVRVFGVDVTLNADLPINKEQKLVLSGSYSFQRAQPRTSRTSSDWMKQVAYIPVNSGSASLSWVNPWVDVAFHATGMSERYTTNANIAETRIPGFIEAGTSLSHRFRLKKSTLEIRGEINNIFNKQYEIVARYPMPGRTWKIGVEFDL